MDSFFAAEERADYGTSVRGALNTGRRANDLQIARTRH
jgi:hypothetical protein